MLNKVISALRWSSRFLLEPFSVVWSDVRFAVLAQMIRCFGHVVGTVSEWHEAAAAKMENDRNSFHVASVIVILAYQVTHSIRASRCVLSVVSCMIIVLPSTLQCGHGWSLSGYNPIRDWFCMTMFVAKIGASLMWSLKSLMRFHYQLVESHKLVVAARPQLLWLAPTNPWHSVDFQLVALPDISLCRRVGKESFLDLQSNSANCETSTLHSNIRDSLIAK